MNVVVTSHYTVYRLLNVISSKYVLLKYLQVSLYWPTVNKNADKSLRLPFRRLITDFVIGTAYTRQKIRYAAQS